MAARHRLRPNRRRHRVSSPLDGARHLDTLRWPARICALVAYHSGAVFLAHAQGLDAELASFPPESTALSDALTYADQTIDPVGRPIALDDRLAEALHRHGPDSPYAVAHPERARHLRTVARRVEGRLPFRSRGDRGGASFSRRST